MKVLIILDHVMPQQLYFLYFIFCTGLGYAKYIILKRLWKTHLGIHFMHELGIVCQNMRVLNMLPYT